MRNFTFAACCLLVSFGIDAAIIGGTDFETGQTVADNPNIYRSGNAAEIVQAENGVTPRSGNWMHRSYINRYLSNTTFRTESVLQFPNGSVHFDKGKEYWVAISIYIPEDWSLDYVNGYSTGLLWQFHDIGYNDPLNCGAGGTSKCWRETLPLTLSHQENGFRIGNSTWLNGYDIKNYSRFSVTVPYKFGQWNDFVMNVKFSGATSPDDTDGFLRVWVNGVQVLNRVGQNYFGEQPEGPYFKFGMYNWGWRPEYISQWVGVDERVVWHDELRVGDANSSYDEVAPPTSVVFKPNPPNYLSVR